MSITRFLSYSIGLAALLTVSATRAAAQDPEVPVDLQVRLLYKIVSFDRNLGARTAGDPLVFAILYQKGFRASSTTRLQVDDAARGESHGLNRPVRWVTIELEETPDLGSALRSNAVDILYVTPLRGTDIRRIVEATRANQVTSFAGVPSYLERGLAVAVGLERGRPRILINLTAARAEGADFSSQLLQMATVVGED